MRTIRTITYVPEVGDYVFSFHQLDFKVRITKIEYDPDGDFITTDSKDSAGFLKEISANGM